MDLMEDCIEKGRKRPYNKSRIISDYLYVILHSGDRVVIRMKLKTRIRDKFHSIVSYLMRPNDWLYAVAADKKALGKLILITAAYVIVGILFNTQWQFPHFALFCSCFLFVGGLSQWAISYFSRKMKSITAAVATQPAAKKANLFYFRHCLNSYLYILIPLLIIFIFGAGCCSMFGAIQLTPTLIWMVLLFFYIVYISIIGYLQYIVLAIYIRNLAHGTGGYQHLPKSMVECIPAQLEWLQALTRLSHTYRTAFFTLGSAYIGGYSAFCWLPEMQANISSPIFFLLWGIILFVIVLMFPIVSVLEYRWIKKIVEQLKACYIKDLAAEQDIKEKSGTIYLSPSVQRLIQTLCATQILNSEDYPLKSIWEFGYAALMSILNLIAAAVTIIQGFPIKLSVLLHIF